MEENELIPVDNNDAVEYTDDNIRHLSDMEHVRTRPGMYIGRLGDGAHAEDGIYVLLKEVIDNSIDEFKMQAGKKIEIIVEENLRVSVRDYGRGIPQGKLIEAVSMLNTGGKYDSKAFKKKCRTEWSRCKSCQCPQFPFRGTKLPRRQGTYRHFLQRRVADGRDTEHRRGQRNLYLLRTGQYIIPELQLQTRIYRDNAAQLHVSQYGTCHHL